MTDCTSDHCVTCADEAVPLRVVSLAADGIAVCLDDAGGTHEVMTDLVGPLARGQVVLVHAGAAIARVE